MPYDKRTGKHYDYTKEGIEEYKKETGKGMPMRKDMAYWTSKSNASPLEFNVKLGAGALGVAKDYLGDIGNRDTATTTADNTGAGKSIAPKDNKALIAALEKQDNVNEEVSKLKTDDSDKIV